jgi:hypothetical protein
MGMAEVFPLRDSNGDLWRAASDGGNKRRPSEGALADRFAARHSKQVRYLAGRERVRSLPARKPQWIAWHRDRCEWLLDNQHVALRLARAVCKEAAEQCDDHTLDSARSVNGLLSLAKADHRLIASDWPCDPEIEGAVDAWLTDHCVLDEDAWTKRSDLLATFVGWEDFDPEDLTAALEARGLSYRRAGNVPGFDGVRIRDEDDE